MSREGALKAWETRRRSKPLTATEKAHASEAASKEALTAYCTKKGWKLAFFEGKTGSPRTGIIDAIAYRLGRRDASGKSNPDNLDLVLVQLKGGDAGITAKEIKRLKDATVNAIVKWVIAEYDGEALQFLPDEPTV
jgi:hypothetical protein